VALTKILCARHWGIEPSFTPAEPDVAAMLRRADAALVIGDPALDIDPARHGATKLDLGEAWLAMTGLPFVYAAWVGPHGAVDADQVALLQAARARGEREVADIAREVAGADGQAEQRVLAYLRDTLRYGLGDREIAGLERFHALAVELGLAPATRPLKFFS
jgi:predicted solute-binding protein